MRKSMLAGLSILFLILGMTCIGNATTIYTDEAAFLSAIEESYYLEDFDGYSGSYGDSLDFGAVNGYSYTMSALVGLYSGGGNMSTSTQFDTLSIDFTGADVTAIGGYFWLTDYDFNNLVGDITTILSLSNGTTYNYNISSANSQTFTGFTTTDSVFTGIEIFTSSGAFTEWPTIDHLYVGSVVPEPSTVALVGVGLLCVGCAARRKNRI